MACCCANAGGTSTCLNCFTALDPPAARNTRPCWVLSQAPRRILFVPSSPIGACCHAGGTQALVPPRFQLADQLLKLIVRDIAVKHQVRDHVPNRYLRRLSSGLSLCLPLLPRSRVPLPTRRFFFFLQLLLTLLFLQLLLQRTTGHNILGMTHGHVHLRPQVGWQVTGE